MQAKNQPDSGIGQVVRALNEHRFRWLFPTVVCTGLSLAYALVVYHPVWEASQALTVREEAMQSGESYGRFNEAEQLKYAQETILELARSQSVVAAALTAGGAPASLQGSRTMAYLGGRRRGPG